MEAFIIYGYKLTEEEVIGLPADIPETWVDKGWLIGSDNSNSWYFVQDVVNTDEQFDLEIEPEELFSGSTPEEFEQFNKMNVEKGLEFLKEIYPDLQQKVVDILKEKCENIDTLYAFLSSNRKIFTNSKLTGNNFVNLFLILFL